MVLNAKSQNTSSEPAKFTESLSNRFQQPYCEQTWPAATVAHRNLALARSDSTTGKRPFIKSFGSIFSRCLACLQRVSRARSGVYIDSWLWERGTRFGGGGRWGRLRREMQQLARRRFTFERPLAFTYPLYHPSGAGSNG